MKKWVMVCLTFMVGSALVACSSSEEKTVTLQAEQDGSSSEITYKAEGDKVIEQSAKNVIPYESLGVTNKEDAEEVLAEFIAGYDDTEGVTHEMDYQDDQVIEMTTLNYEEADLSEVNELSGSSFEGDLDGDVSLEKSVELLEQQGFEVVE